MPACKRRKNGKMQYRTAYRWIDECGVEHQTTTPWFNTKLEADQEAKKIKRQKDNPIGKEKSTKRVGVVFNEFIGELEKEVNDNTLKNKSTEVSLLQKANSINNSYFPESLKNKQIKEVNSAYFRKWLESMNKEKISGQTIRSFKNVLHKFNKFLANTGYYEKYNTDIEISVGLGKVDIKPVKSGERKDRRVPTQNDIKALELHYVDKLGTFRNFYYYTLFYFEFYTGMRVSETVGLQWKNVDLSEDNRVIYVRNAINEKEKRKTALKRTQVGNYSTKNDTSERGVIIFDIIYNLLKDYRNRYMIHYKLKESEIDECFVFPAMTNPMNYAKASLWLAELYKACDGAGIERFDNGMMRHGCATWLVAPSPDGLGYSPEQVYSQLGHCDSSMINAIYGKLQKNQMTQKNRIVFNDIYHPEENKEYLEEKKEKERLLHFAKGNNDIPELAYKIMRFTQELERIKHSKNKVFYYYESDEEAIEKANLREEYKEIEFIKKNGK